MEDEVLTAPEDVAQALRENAATVRDVVLRHTDLVRTVGDALCRMDTLVCVELTGPVTIAALLRVTFPPNLLELRIHDMVLDNERVAGAMGSDWKDDTDRFVHSVIRELPRGLRALTVRSFTSHVCRGLTDGIATHLTNLEELELDGIRMYEWHGLRRLRGLLRLWIGHCEPLDPFHPDTAVGRAAEVLHCRQLYRDLTWLPQQSAFLATRCPNVPCTRLSCYAPMNAFSNQLRFPHTAIWMFK